jgi:hypothetical protein
MSNPDVSAVADAAVTLGGLSGRTMRELCL